MDEFVVVGAYGSEMEADLVVQRLAGAGIDATTRSDNVGGMFPSMDLATGGVEVVVPASQLSDAQRALSQTDRAPSARERHRKAESLSISDRSPMVRRVVIAGVFIVLIVVVLAAMLNFLDNPIP